MACCVGDVSSRVSPVVDVRGVRVAGHGLGGAPGAPHGGRPARGERDGGGGVVSRGVPVLLDARMGCRSARPGAGAADRDQAARPRCADRGRARRHPVPPLGTAGVGSFWTHDGSAQDPNALGRGNRWVVAGIIVELAFCSHPVCLPILFRLWRGKATPSPVRLAGQLITLLAKEFPEYTIHPVGDGAYHGEALLTEGTTFTTRLPANAVLYAPPPPRTGKRGRPRLKGHRLGTPAELAATAGWRRVPVTRDGRRDTVEAAEIPALWYGPFGNQPSRVVLVHDPGDPKILAIFTTDLDGAIEHVVSRYPHRWPIETAIAAGKQLLGIGQARNRLQRAVERTVPFQFIVYSASSGTRCTATIATTSPNAEPPSPGTGTRASRPTKTCSPSSAEPLLQHELPALPQLIPTPTNTATTNWPAPQPPRNCETQDWNAAREIGVAATPDVRQS